MRFTRSEISELGNLIKELQVQINEKNENVKELKNSGGTEYTSLLETELSLLQKKKEEYEKIARNAEEKYFDGKNLKSNEITWQTMFLAKVRGGKERIYIISNMPGEKSGMIRVPETCPLGKAVIGKGAGEHTVSFGENQANVTILKIF